MTEREKLIKCLRTTQMAPGDVAFLGFKAAVVKMVLDTPGVIYLPTSGPEFEAAVERALRASEDEFARENEVRPVYDFTAFDRVTMAAVVRAALSPDSPADGEDA